MRRRWETTDIEIANLTYYVRAKQVFHSFIPILSLKGYHVDEISM